MANKKKTRAQDDVEIPRIELKKVRIKIEGLSPLLVNAFSNKAKQQIEDKQTGKPMQAKKAKDPHQCYLDAFYRLSDGRPGIPAVGLKKAAVQACTFVENLAKTEARGAFHVVAEEGWLVSIQGQPKAKDAGAVMDTRAVRLQGIGRPADLRYRPRFDKWSITFDVIYNSRFISPAELLNLYETAGFHVGLCEFRPEKGGDLGMFQVSRS